MSFLSVPFVLFVLVAAALFQLSPARFRTHILLAASWAFYATYGPWYALLLLVGLTVAAHRTALRIEHASDEERKFTLVAWTVSSLVVVLAGFKLASAFSASTSAPAIVGEESPLRFLVPLGLSYYLFKLLAYLLEVYWERIPAEQSVVAVGLYAAFFPQIVSGPIQRPADFFQQLAGRDRVDPELMASGLRRILFGVFKKIAIADRLAVLVDAVHANPRDYSSLELLLAAYVYAIQLYADFSGITDIALGVGQLFGIQGPENFELPFFARNLQEYWRRWHMSLSSWLADYLFTPLRMALRNWGQFGLALAVVINMVAIGVWHGISWTYAAFGLYHGVCLAISVLTLKNRDAFFRRHGLLSRARSVVAPLVTFHLVVLGLVIFRANSFAGAVDYITHFVSGWRAGAVAATRLDFKLLQVPPKALLGLAMLCVLMELIHAAKRQPEWVRRFVEAPRPYRWAAYYGFILLTLAFSRLGEEKFIYAQF